MNCDGFKPVHRGDLPVFEDGAPILATGFEFPEDETPAPADGGELLGMVLGRFVDDAPPETIGRRFLLLGYLSGSPGAPKSQRALARKMGVSVSRVNSILAKLRLELRDLYARG